MAKKVRTDPAPAVTDPLLFSPSPQPPGLSRLERLEFEFHRGATDRACHDEGLMPAFIREKPGQQRERWEDHPKPWLELDQVFDEQEFNPKQECKDNDGHDRPLRS